MNIERYHNLVIGSGEAGKYLAWNLAQMGQTTALVERSLIGGSCPNIACLPSKNVIYSAKVVALVDRANGLGVVSGSLQVDMQGVARRKRAMVDGLIELHLANFKASGAELIMGEAQFTGPKTVNVALNDGGSRQLVGDRVFLSVGSRASIPNVPGLLAAQPMTHIEALNLQRLPEHLIVLGGGYIGLEFAQALRRFGSRVTILQRGSRLLDREDSDVSDALLDLMKDEGIDVFLATSVLSVAGRSGESVNVRLRSGDNEFSVEASDILVATGRTPNSDKLDAAAAGIDLDSRGYIQVNERLETSASDVWAMGDCAGSPQFTHAAYDDFRVILSNLSGGNRTKLKRLMPYCLFTDPELAHIGMSETEARASNVPYRVARLPAAKVLRMRTISQTRGFIKALIGDDDRILGFTAFCAEASELVAAVQTAMLGGLPYQLLRDAIFTHPTVSEGLVFLFGGRLERATGGP